MTDNQPDNKMRATMKRIETLAKGLSDEMLLYGSNILIEEMERREQRQADYHEKRMNKINLKENK